MVRKKPFPIIEFIEFEDGFTPSGFWKHTLYNVTHTSLTLILFSPDTVARRLTQTHTVARALEAVAHTHTVSLWLSLTFNNAH